MTDPGPLTRFEWVDRHLREAILSGDLAPGERLITATLSERFSVSPTPLREALQRLAAQGLVESSPQRGARVTPLSLREWRELADLRLLLESRGCRRSIGNGGDHWVASVRQQYHELNKVWTNEQTPLSVVEQAYRSFLTAVISACGSSWIIRIEDQLLIAAARYHVLAFQQIDRDVALGVHEQLTAACENRRAKDADQLVRRALDQLTDAVEALANSGTIIGEDDGG